MGVELCVLTADRILWPTDWSGGSRWNALQPVLSWWIDRNGSVTVQRSYRVWRWYAVTLVFSWQLKISLLLFLIPVICKRIPGTNKLPSRLKSVAALSCVDKFRCVTVQLCGKIIQFMWNHLFKLVGDQTVYRRSIFRITSNREGITAHFCGLDSGHLLIHQKDAIITDWLVVCLYFAWWQHDGHMIGGISEVFLVSTETGDHLQVYRPSIRLGYPGQLSLAILSCVGIMSTSHSYG